MRRADSTWRYWTFLAILALGVPTGVAIEGLWRLLVGGMVGLAYGVIIGYMQVKEKP